MHNSLALNLLMSSPSITVGTSNTTNMFPVRFQIDEMDSSSDNRGSGVNTGIKKTNTTQQSIPQPKQSHPNSNRRRVGSFAHSSNGKSNRVKYKYQMKMADNINHNRSIIECLGMEKEKDSNRKQLINVYQEWRFGGKGNDNSNLSSSYNNGSGSHNQYYNHSNINHNNHPLSTNATAPPTAQISFKYHSSGIRNSNSAPNNAFLFTPNGLPIQTAPLIHSRSHGLHEYFPPNQTDYSLPLTAHKLFATKHNARIRSYSSHRQIVNERITHSSQINHTDSDWYQSGHTNRSYNGAATTRGDRQSKQKRPGSSRRELFRPWSPLIET